MGCKNWKIVTETGEFATAISRDMSQFGWKRKRFPCGQCKWCRYVLSRDWAARCYLENKMHTASAFVTLTYRDQDLPEGGTLVPKHLTGFMKRLRRYLDYQSEWPVQAIRYFGSGEYGDAKGRPHYHVLIYGFGFPDKSYWKTSEKGFPLFRSEFLEKCWKFGHSWIGDVELESSAYVAQYIRKKINGDLKESHYEGREPEFSRQSMKPGIGGTWYEANKSWLWDEDEVRIEGRSYRPPKYFETLLRAEDPERLEDVYARRDVEDREWRKSWKEGRGDDAVQDNVLD